MSYIYTPLKYKKKVFIKKRKDRSVHILGENLLFPPCDLAAELAPPVPLGMLVGEEGIHRGFRNTGSAWDWIRRIGPRKVVSQHTGATKVIASGALRWTGLPHWL